MDAKARAQAMRSGICPTAAADATAKVTLLQTELDEASNRFPASVVKAFAEELAAAKLEQTILHKGGATKTAREAVRTRLESRVGRADEAAAGAALRHQAQVNALDAQMAQLLLIKQHRILDSAESQKAFATRLTEDKETSQEVVCDLSKLVGAPTAPPAAPMVIDQIAQSVNQGVLTALEDLLRHCDVPCEELPTCPDSIGAPQVNSLAALWRFYAQVGFG
jgi:hypothetical protein